MTPHKPSNLQPDRTGVIRSSVGFDIPCKCGGTRLVGQQCIRCMRAYHRTISADLADTYIRRLLKWKDAPQEVIELKRAQLKIKRTIHERTHHIG